MSDTGLASSLNIVTLVAVLIIAAILFLYFMRKRSNRHPMDTPRGKAAEDMRRKEAEEERREEGRPKL
ncbi:LPXTG cell wall anchor domain-containing protein [Aurantiacibacter poecillastricola]|uniref:LPXTG cell wall anchor domain-containing protein n=1 Tax=Aurantiacibacter poecillastricola TaxID=3064385 RepID=UPI00273D9CF7|nr:LPXTG cell wall anchor domain-containing protein [Aurantiacibacter sp. 219JJ12-13]MDP5261029.1 LPXTG cell wall anchor domain-containing protein [Aurantiacibacter sp. 219JJ12-13]